eukprot:s886_g9.t1
MTGSSSDSVVVAKKKGVFAGGSDLQPRTPALRTDLCFTTWLQRNCRGVRHLGPSASSPRPTGIMDAEGAAGKSKAKRQWKKINPGEILDIQSYEDQRKGSEVKGKGKQNEKGKGRGNGKGSENGEGKGKGKGKNREEDPTAETSPQNAEPRSFPRSSPKGGRRDGKGKGRRKGSFQSPQGGGFQAEEPTPATEEARPAAPPQVASGTAHMAGSQFPAVGKGAMGAFMSPAPMGHQMPFEMPMQMYPPAFMGGMGMPYMGYTPDGMMAPMAMPGPMGPALGTGGVSTGAGATSSPQRNDLVAKAKTQIEYYFSVNNLVKDVHLRKNVMDTQGWVSFSGLIQFPKLQQLTRTSENVTGDPTIILDAIHELPQLEMKPDNSAVRLKDNGRKQGLQIASRQLAEMGLATHRQLKVNTEEVSRPHNAECRLGSRRLPVGVAESLFVDEP